MTDIPKRQIRAVYDSDTIRVYQAYGSAIADSLIQNGQFTDPPFKLTRMTWIKPSFEEITDIAKEAASHLSDGDIEKAHRLLPVERPYPLGTELAEHIGATS